jgi:aminopeptidase
VNNEIIEKYANVMVNFAVNGGNGIKKGDNVRISYPMAASPLGREIYKQVILAGGNPFTKINDEELSLVEYQYANDDQLKYFPKKYFRSYVDLIDHSIIIMAPENLFLLKNIDPKKIMLANNAYRPYYDWVHKKEDEGKYSWTLCLYPTEGLAKEAGLTVEEYWEQIIKACFLNVDDSVKKWQEISNEQNRIMNILNKLPIDKINIVSEGTDLWITLGENGLVVEVVIFQALKYSHRQIGEVLMVK